MSRQICVDVARNNEKFSVLHKKNFRVKRIKKKHPEIYNNVIII